MKRMVIVLLICLALVPTASATIVDDLYATLFGVEEQIVAANETFVIPPLVENLSITEDSITLFINNDNESAMVTTSNPDLTTGTTEDVVIVRSR